MKTKTCPHCKWHVTTGKNKVVILCDRHVAVDDLVEALMSAYDSAIGRDESDILAAVERGRNLLSRLKDLK